MSMSIIQEQTHEQILDDQLIEHGCRFLHEYNYRVKRLACGYINIQQLQARLNYVESYHSERLADVHHLWLGQKTLILDELKQLVKRKDYNSFALAMQQTLKSWREYYRENQYVN